MHFLQLFRTAKSPCGFCRCLVSSFIRRDAKSTCEQLPSFHLQRNSYCTCALRQNCCVSCPSYFFFPEEINFSLVHHFFLNYTNGGAREYPCTGKFVYTYLNTCYSLCSHHSCANPCNPSATHKVPELKRKLKNKGKLEQCPHYLELVWCVPHHMAGW